MAQQIPKGNGTATVVTATSAVQLGANKCKRVFVQALDDNDGVIVVGDSTVVAAQATRKGLALFPSQGEWFNVENTNNLWIDSTASGDKVAFYFDS